MTSGSTTGSHREPTPLHGGHLTNRSLQQRGGMAAEPPPSPPYGYSGQPVPGSPTSISPRSSAIAPLLLEATTPKVLLPSRQLLLALLVVPELLWLLVVLVGVYHSEPIPEGLSKTEFEHPLAWFDRHVFRVWGPLLPLGPYVIRVMSLGLRTRAPAPSGSKPLVRLLLPSATLPLAALLLQLVVILVRLALYLGHLALQRRTTETVGGSLRGLVLVSDHLLLAASVVAGFQSELVMCVSDVFKAELLRPLDRGTGVRQLAVVAALVSSMFVMVAVMADMYCTARWYHHPRESLAALAAGALVFQLPVVAWLLKKSTETRAQTPRATRSFTPAQ